VSPFARALSGTVSALLLFTGSSQAASISVDLTIPESDAIVFGFTPGVVYATVTVADAGADIRFTVDANNAFWNEGSRFGVQQFGFNLASGAAPLTAANIAGLPAGWSVSLDKTISGFGVFDIGLGSNGPRRQDPLSFLITGISGDSIHDYLGLSSGTAGSGNTFFAAHIAGFTGSGMWFLKGSTTPCSAGTSNCEEISSAFFGAPLPPQTAVPVPAAAWLFGPALALLGALRRRARLAAAA